VTAGPGFIRFGLLVTGDTEREHLPKLFRSLAATHACAFTVIRKFDQRSTRTSTKKKLKVVGSEKMIPTRDMAEIGIPARAFLDNNSNGYVLLIDDLEYDRSQQETAIFERYRAILDSATKVEAHRCSVHFLVFMLEAYFWADANAINRALSPQPPLEDFKEDVETMRHPKNALKDRFPGYREKEHGGRILQELDVAHVLRDPATCSSLRTLLAWCLAVMQRGPDWAQKARETLNKQFHLADGVMRAPARNQIPDS